MKTRTIIILSIILAIVVAVVFYVNRPMSPSKTASISAEGLNIEVLYSAPYKKGRMIFGDEGSGALLPYGKYWRLGANRATEITFDKNITLGGKRIKAGSYRMYAIPGEKVWQIVLNSELGKSGAEMPDHALDVLTVEANVHSFPTETEQFIIDFDETRAEISMKFIWDHTEATVPIGIK